MADKIIKMTIAADSIKEAEEIAKAEKGVKDILKTEAVIYEVTVIQEK